MSYVLKNSNLEVLIDAPLENYRNPRFDWTGKIVSIKFKKIPVTTIENKTVDNDLFYGKGLYNEFGIDSALGFNEAKTGDWFHKIGIGLLKKDHNQYKFDNQYKIKPATFRVSKKSNVILIRCTSDQINGYSYVLTKQIELLDCKLKINYSLLNTGEKKIVTDEYTHNFIAMNDASAATNNLLKFPFQLKPLLFEENVNPENKVVLGVDHIAFKSTPKEQFYFSNLSGSESIEASWELINHKTCIGLKETGNFKTNKINLWGWEHVISPELFVRIDIAPQETQEWSRTYDFYQASPIQ